MQQLLVLEVIKFSKTYLLHRNFKNDTAPKINNNLYYGHWFDGDGMATSLSFSGNGALPKFTSKFIQTRKYIKQRNEQNEILAKGAWTQSTRWYNNIFKHPSNPSNTNLVYFSNQLLMI